ncbi:hypothetical protein Pryu01_02345 [Paraliobacillus ryukyuensis]|uniref:Nuclease-like protein n=1 Tax=Paraliobacillus ryukyuensis TaxID=200904 RepID=A0A366DWS6_9BACI|nr:nuclease-related domain-containing protein [Paraliobacillus ryukyuensis]RBO94561.1 nuclease-like protein [Paraliobacillus ryukyuensis]
MIIRPPQKTKRLSQLAIFKERCQFEAEDILEQYGKELAGYLGEKRLPYFIDVNTALLHDDLYGLRLEVAQHHFQMDGLFIFPTFLLITEVKHMNGKLVVNDANQLIQVKDAIEKVYQHPLQQANLQKAQLHLLLQELGYDPPPIHTLVIFSHDQAQVNFHHSDMLPIHQLPFRLKELNNQYTKEIFGKQERYLLANKLLSKHQERPLSFIPTMSNVRKGALCKKCKFNIMRRTYGTWTCTECGLQNKTAHISALKDFAYLFGPRITNKQFRDFLLIDSKYTASRLLRSMNLKVRGQTYQRQYDLSNFIE